MATPGGGSAGGTGVTAPWSRRGRRYQVRAPNQLQSKFIWSAIIWHHLQAEIASSAQSLRLSPGSLHEVVKQLRIRHAAASPVSAASGSP